MSIVRGQCSIVIGGGRHLGWETLGSLGWTLLAQGTVSSSLREGNCTGQSPASSNSPVLESYSLTWGSGTSSRSA